MNLAIKRKIVKETKIKLCQFCKIRTEMELEGKGLPKEEFTCDWLDISRGVCPQNAKATKDIVSSILQ